jgi:PKD repeat protein
LLGPGDINNDGFIDIIYGYTIYKNNGNSNNWLTVTVEGTNSNRNGIGARVEIYGAWGKQIRDIRSGIGFRYMGTLNAHFGLGNAAVIDSVIVRWPSGNVDLVCNPDKNSVLHIIENSGAVPLAAFTSSTNIIDEGESVVFSDASEPCVTLLMWSVNPTSGWAYSNGSNPSSINPTITFNDAGSYIVSLVAYNSNGSSTNISSDTIQVNSTAGLTESMAKGISLYPNPANQMLYISGKNIRIVKARMFSVLGEQVHVQFNFNDASMPVNHLQSGTYFLELTDINGDVIVKRFMKQ